MDKPRIDVFISSTSIDLPDYRAAVRDAILSLDFHPVGMETWPVNGENPVSLCREMVEKSEIYLGIYAHRYGWRPEGYGGKSITELEYDWAGTVYRDGKAIPRLCFIMDDRHPWDTTLIEHEAREDLLKFKARVSKDYVGFFTTAEDLKAKVSIALAKVLAAMKQAEGPINWSVGASFDNYRLERVLGTGGNGQVWLAAERLPDASTRPVAIKVLRAEVGENPTRAARFRREISSMARIDYPHIVRVYTYGERAGQLYVVMPYLSGGTLRSRLDGSPVAEALALEWLEQIGAALDHVHDRHSGLIHRDVKPENLLLGEDGTTLHLADFGLVFSQDDRVTEDGKPVGSGRYMAPEQWRGETLSRQTDLYALGILAYELLTGHLPYPAVTDYELGRAHCERELPGDAHLAEEVLAILRRAAAKNPVERYPTARAFLTDLRHWREAPANVEPRIRDYLKWVTEDLYEGVRAQFVELAGEERARQWLPARYKRAVWDDEDDLFARASAAVQADHIPVDEGTEAFVANVRERLLALERAVLIGEPGSGKSWMLRRLQADYARAWLRGSGEGRGLVPVLVRLNEYNGGSFEDFVRAALDMLAPYHDRLRDEKRLVLLCDALNEMPRGGGQMGELVGYLANAPNFVVSCRVRDYKEDDLNALKPLEQVRLRDLELPAIRELVEKRLPDGQGERLWREMGGTQGLFDFWQKARKANESVRFWDAKTEWWQLQLEGFHFVPSDWQAMHSGARLIPLCRNPYMGDLLCRTYEAAAGVLPGSRAALFGQFINQMLAREARAAARRGEGFPEFEAIEAALVALARALQASRRTVIAEDEAAKAVGGVGAGSGVLLKAATDANILNTDSEGLKFAHQLLQEYFAARILLEALENDDNPGVFLGDTWWDAGVWRETTVILGEFLGEGAAGPNRAARWLGPVTPEVALQVITRNGGGLTLTNVETETRQSLIASANHKTGEPDPRGRAAAYRVLGLLAAEDRPGIGVKDGLPDIAWSKPIPPGMYPIGGVKQDYPSLPAEQYQLEYSYQVSQYPITARQFQAFLDAEDGYGSPDHDWFAGLAADDDDKQMREQYFKYENHPRESVNWYQAVAFCRWLSWRLTGKNYDVSEIGEWPVRLPQEKEWEIAARGPDGLVYPYGSAFDAAKGNTSETGIGQTSAVGIFPAGAAWCGAEDLSGNVWEWCLNPRDDPDGGLKEENMHSASVRVLRGGSWFFDRLVARAASRDYGGPGDWYDIIGFRVVSLP